MLNNPRHEKFCLEYAACGNATEAYLKAGYGGQKRKTKNVAAFNLLKKPKIAERIKELTAEIKREKIADVVECQEILTVIARDKFYPSNVTKFRDGNNVCFVKTPRVTPIVPPLLKRPPIVITGGDKLED